MPQIRLVKNGSGEVIRVGSTTIRIVEDGSLTDNRLGAAVITVAPRTGPVPPHLHRMHDETFLVTEGTIRFTVDDIDYDAEAGDLVVVPTGAAHTFSNPFDQPATFFNTFTPAYYVNYFRDLGKAATNGRQPTEDDIVTARNHYATEPA